MSIKNPSRFAIFASVIIGVTVLSLVGLYFIVDKISKSTPPSMTVRMPKPGPPSGLDDSLNREKQKSYSQQGTSDTFEAPTDFPASYRESTPDSPKRRRSSGGMGQGLNTPSHPMGGQYPPGMPMGMPPNMQNGYYPPPSFPGNMSPQDQALFEQEMERRRQMMMDQAPQGYPYPGPQEMMDDSYGPPYYEPPYYGPPEDYYYDPDYQSKNDKTDKPLENELVQLADVEHIDEMVDDQALEEAPANDDFVEDDYLIEYMDQDF